MKDVKMGQKLFKECDSYAEGVVLYSSCFELLHTVSDIGRRVELVAVNCFIKHAAYFLSAYFYGLRP